MRKLKIGIVGLNFGQAIIREQLINGPARPYFELGAVCDTDPARLEALSRQYGVKAYRSIEQLTADAEIDVVGLFTGPHGRAGLIRQIIDNGKDVVTTKPFELDARAALEVLREAQSRNRIVHLNSPAPTCPGDIRCIKDWQSEHQLGRCIAIQWQTWANYREQRDNTWYDDPTTCPVAPILRLGIYGINDILRFLHAPKELHVMHAQIFTQRPTPDTAQLSIRFKNGEIANLFASFCVDDGNPYPDSMIVTFENGVVYRNTCPRTSVGPTDAALMLQAHKPNTSSPIIAEASIPYHERSGQYQWDILYRAIQGESIQYDTTPEMVADGIGIIQAMAQADAAGTSIMLRDHNDMGHLQTRMSRPKAGSTHS